MGAYVYKAMPELNNINVKANETSREELLTRDVYIQFEEIRRVRKENEELKKQIKQYQRDFANLSGLVGRYKNKIAILESSDESAEEIGFYIKKQRESLGYSSRAFAKILGISQPTLLSYENARGSLPNAIKLADKIREERKNGIFRKQH